MGSAIGGFFELELPHCDSGYHLNASALTNGRACISQILEIVRPSLCHVPFYTCTALIEPMKARNIPCKFYSITSHLEPADLPKLEASECFIYINYFGLKREAADRLRTRLGTNLIVDNTHDFFDRGHPDHWSFTSARKYFGVPDGAYLYGPADPHVKAERFQGIRLQHSIDRLLGRSERAYQEFKEYEESLTSEIYRISECSERLLSAVDYEAVQARRQENYAFYAERLNSFNELDVPGAAESPFCYPLLPVDTTVDKSTLYKENYFIPTLWPELLAGSETKFEWERDLALRLLPLPVDHRYTPEQLSVLVDFIIKKLGN